MIRAQLISAGGDHSAGTELGDALILFRVVVPLSGGLTVNAKSGALFRVVDGERHRWARFPGSIRFSGGKSGVVSRRGQSDSAMARTNGDAIRAVGCPG
ncbi:hypothetical protein [Corynebacterium sp. TAE3-ERU16]|uniref:hypothetical protein n=1 Tax=Corynebacterium sp. TAE3-ERU16 TaxID=2849493 RepID=UPI001C46015E|nr:hypothetical protein [Corynebacterium sp. TAE3-ERU16]MBV7292781.1 hypothetical protein [Corynebacterium sp. TAE3-ERU16]